MLIFKLLPQQFYDIKLFHLTIQLLIALFLEQGSVSTKQQLGVRDT
jgi:hypothetical protein